jgi:putative FmdB family regulatory protein
MPIFEYQCTKCGHHYDVLHLTKEREEDIVCPTCQSAEHKRLMSAPAIMIGHQSSMDCSPDSCQNPAGCCGGACAMEN